MRSAIIPAIVVAALASAAANAAPMAPLKGLASTSAVPVWSRGGNWGDHPLMYGGNWQQHQQQWNAFEGRTGNAQSTSCARFRSYDRASQTYVNRNGRRVACP